MSIGKIKQKDKMCLEELDNSLFGDPTYKVVDNHSYALSLVDLHALLKHHSLGVYIVFFRDIHLNLEPLYTVRDISSLKLIESNKEGVVCEAIVKGNTYHWLFRLHNNTIP